MVFAARRAAFSHPLLAEGTLFRALRLARAVDLTLRPVGVVRSPYATPLDAPRQGEFAQAEATIEVFPEYEEALAGVEALETVLVVWWAHQAQRDLLRRPGTDGVFAMRTPHRPNPICLSEARVVRREGRRLVVTGLEATDGTPVLDLKAARAEYDGWIGLPGTQLE